MGPQTSLRMRGTTFTHHPLDFQLSVALLTDHLTESIGTKGFTLERRHHGEAPASLAEMGFIPKEYWEEEEVCPAAADAAPAGYCKSVERNFCHRTPSLVQTLAWSGPPTFSATCPRLFGTRSSANRWSGAIDAPTLCGSKWQEKVRLTDLPRFLPRPLHHRAPCCHHDQAVCLCFPQDTMLFDQYSLEQTMLGKWLVSSNRCEGCAPDDIDVVVVPSFLFHCFARHGGPFWDLFYSLNTQTTDERREQVYTHTWLPNQCHVTDVAPSSSLIFSFPFLVPSPRARSSTGSKSATHMDITAAVALSSSCIRASLPTRPPPK